MKSQSVFDEPYEIILPCIRVEQPLGSFFVSAIDAQTLREITFSDVRRMEGEREVETYLGIQREVDPTRVKELGKYVNTIDATFPTSVILAVREDCAEYDETAKTLKLKSLHDEEGKTIVSRIEIAKVLDGQHRIEGLREFSGEKFEVNVSIFVDMDIADQAYLFSVVNLAQTKVKKSLVYDLYEYSRSRSPQKSAHNIAVAMDQISSSPLHKKIKRLGSATPHRRGETLTQATFVEAMLSLMTDDAVVDRDLYKRGKRPSKVSESVSRRLIFRNLFLDEEDMKVADILMAYFSAIQDRWSIAWKNPENGYMLAKTSGFRGLIRFLPLAYAAVSRIGDVPTKEQFADLFGKSKLKDEQFVVTEFLPGTAGESKLFRTLRDELTPVGKADFFK